MALYDVGDRVRLSAEFYDLDDAPIDPSTVACTVREPSGGQTDYAYPGEITRVAAGSYYLECDLPEPGVWWVRWHSTGVGQAAEETSLTVRESAVLS